MVAYKVIALLDRTDKLLRNEILNVISDAVKKGRLLKAREKIQEALTLLIGG